MIFDLGFSTKSKDQDTDFESTETGVTSATRTGVQLQDEKEKQLAAATEEAAFLDPETLEALRSLIPELTGAAGRGAIATEEAADLAPLLVNRAADTQRFVDERTQAITDAARARGEERIRANTTANAARVGGSTLNTLVQEGTRRSGIQLDTELAALEGQLALQGRELEDAALLNAFGATTQVGQGSTTPLLSVVNLLRGATESRESVSGGFAERSGAFLSLEDILNALNVTREGEQSSSGSETGFGFGIGI